MRYSIRSKIHAVFLQCALFYMTYFDYILLIYKIQTLACKIIKDINNQSCALYV